jgi:hypothetical protein
MKQKIQMAVDEAIKNGTRKLRITYRCDAIQGLYALRALVDAGMLTMSSGDSAVALSVIMTRDWEHDENRSFTVLLTEKFQGETFVAPMALYLEKIAYARPKQTA